MCIIFGCFGGRPSEALLEEGERRNDDGAGVAWVEGGEVRYEKGLDLDEVIRLTHKDKMPFPFAIHFRTATHGGAIAELTHPFPLVKGIPLHLSGKAPAVLFHNGVWRKWDDMVINSALGRGAEIPDGAWSDSRGLAYCMHHHGEGLLRVSGTEGGRVLLLYARKKQPFRFWGDWSHEHEKDGFWTSQPISCSVFTKSRTKTVGQDHLLTQGGQSPDPSWTGARGGRGGADGDGPARRTAIVMDAADKCNASKGLYMCGVCDKWFYEDRFRAHRGPGGDCPKAPTARDSATTRESSGQPTSSGKKSTNAIPPEQVSSLVAGIAASANGPILGADGLPASGPSIHVFTSEELIDISNELSSWLALKAGFRTFKVEYVPQNMQKIPSGAFGWPSSLD